MKSKAAPLKISDVHVGYDDKPVVRNIDIEIKEGEFFGLMGLNGAGKTTLIKSILGLRATQSGQIELLGVSRNDTQRNHDIAYLPERFEPPWFLTGVEFIKFSLKLYNKSFDEDEVYEAAESLALGAGDLRRRVSAYSKGMRQKLGLLATILTGCRLLILDEPMSGLDPMARSLVKDALKICKKNKQTILFCSHVLADMEEICDRVTLMHEGTLQFTGAPSGLKAKTSAKNLERAFMNFIQSKSVV